MPDTMTTFSRATPISASTAWTPAMIEAFMQLGERYPDIAGEIYVLASAGTGAPKEA